MTTDVFPTAAELTDAVRRIKELDAVIKPLNEERDDLLAFVKAALEAGADPIIAEPYVATLRDKRTGESVDLAALAENDPDAGAHLVSLARAGLLTTPVTRLRPLKGKTPWADAALRRLDPGGVTKQLVIERAD